VQYAIVLRSKYTGEETHLGSSYNTREEAQEYADENVCTRCNYIDIRMIRDEWMWADRHRGFMSIERVLRYDEQGGNVPNTQY